ncbi:MAG: hypothetical protein ACOC46_02945, partial [Pirellulales bacterium]
MKSTRQRLVMVSLVASSMSVVLPSARAADGDRQSLRAAVEDLMATFPREYGKGSEYLKRLESLAPDDAAGFAKLQREALVANPMVSGAPILYVCRAQCPGDHHNTATMFQTGEI